MMFLTLFLLIVMEVSLSFDNAVINASVLQRMPEIWQKRFITWGMLIAVFGMRLVFPVLIVSMAAHVPLFDVVNMAVHAPDQYAAHLNESHVKIASFGGIFLMMVFFSFLMDEEKKVHWFGPVERWLSDYGVINGISCVMGIGTLLIVQHFLHTPAEKLEVILYGLAGIQTYMLIQGLTALTGISGDKVVASGFASFMYLEVLDASCSFDGVIGAFVLTDNIFLIMIGLGIGALAVRSLTLYIVRGGHLNEYIYLEHGAHWGIGALATIMLVNIFYPVPEPFTGLMGMSFIGLSLLSSIHHRRKNESHK